MNTDADTPTAQASLDSIAGTLIEIKECLDGIEDALTWSEGRDEKMNLIDALLLLATVIEVHR